MNFLKDEQYHNLFGCYNDYLKENKEKQDIIFCDLKRELEEAKKKEK